MALSQVYLEWKEATKQEGRLEGLQEGLQEGRQEGLQEGRQEEAANLVLRLLTRKLANLSETMVKRVKKLTIPQLENLGETLLEFTQIGDLETFLSKLESKPEQSTLTQLDTEQPDQEN
jgi:predicted transposase YdaD